jgi:hypothetical protein
VLQLTFTAESKVVLIEMAISTKVTNETLQRLLNSDVALYFASIDLGIDLATLFDGKLF